MWREFACAKIFVFITLFLCANCHNGLANCGYDCQIEILIAKINEKNTPDERFFYSSKLAILTRNIPSNEEIDIKTIKDISNLLYSDVDEVKSMAATSLGNLGERASSAIPSLLDILRREVCSGPSGRPYMAFSPNLAVTIRVSLEKVGYRYTGSVCN